MTRRRAFSLIEVLLVLAVIAVLLSLVFASVSKARDLARTTVCLSNLREIGAASLVYSARYSNYIIPAGYAHKTENAAGGGTRRDTETWATLLVNEKILSAPVLDSIDSPIHAGRSALHCPSGNDDVRWSEMSATSSVTIEIPDRTHARAQHPIRAKSDKTGVIVDSWYGMNGTYKDFKTRLFPCRRLPDHSNQSDFSLVSLRQVPNVNRMVFMYDGVWIDPYVDPDRISARHGRNALTNILFLDGHAATFATKDLPGGMGPNPRDVSPDPFHNSKLGANPTGLMWRLDGTVQ